MKTATKYKTVTTKQAENQGYAPVTTPYSDTEEWMLEKALVDLKGTAFLLVGTTQGIEIWRKRTEVKFTNGLKSYW